MLQDNFRQVEENIRKACGRAGRDPREVTLIAVSKTKPTEVLQEAYDFGTRGSSGRIKCRSLQTSMRLFPKISTGI